jgi:hypothetical protein
MDSVYCKACDLIFEEDLLSCPRCRGIIEIFYDDDDEEVDDGRQGTAFDGMLLLAILHGLQFVTLFFGEEYIWFIGITQIVYGLPALVVVAVQGKYRTMAGVLIAAGLTFVLNIVALGVLCAGMLSGVR